MSGFTCGVWLARRERGLVAVVVDEDGRAMPPRVFDRDRDAQWDLLAWLDNEVALDCDLVLPDGLAGDCELAHFALERGTAVWLVPPVVLHCLRIVANLGTGPPARAAAALARVPLAPMLRQYLCRLLPPGTPRQPLA